MRHSGGDSLEARQIEDEEARGELEWIINGVLIAKQYDADQALAATLQREEMAAAVAAGAVLPAPPAVALLPEGSEPPRLNVHHNHIDHDLCDPKAPLVQFSDPEPLWKRWVDAGGIRSSPVGAPPDAGPRRW
jgi:hypothetical protein